MGENLPILQAYHVFKTPEEFSVHFILADSNVMMLKNQKLPFEKGNLAHLKRITLITLERHNVSNHVSVSNFDPIAWGLWFRTGVQTYSCEKMRNLDILRNIKCDFRFT